MPKFDTYFLMTVEDAAHYVKEKLELFHPEAILHSKEIGDGNLNYVFQIWEENTGKSVIVKQAGPEARISSDFKLSTDRNRIEAEILINHGVLAPGLVPKVYHYDEVMSCCCMEDLSDHVIMRKGLMNYEKYPYFAEHITTYMANTLLLTTDICMEHKEKKAAVKNFINPQLCEITEDLVYTEPYNNIGDRNNVFDPIRPFVEKELYQDHELHLEVAKCKFEFMNNTQALIHGDLHTGSIFVAPESTKVIDPEFAFYGPMGYDIGNVIANLNFAWNYAQSTLEDEKRRVDYLSWLEDTISKTIDLFIDKYNDLYEAQVKDSMAKTPGFKEWYLDTIMADTAAVAGLESIRRTVGLANVKDITSIEDEGKRIKAEKVCILTGKEFIKNRKRFKNGKDFVNILKTIASAVEN